MPLKRKRGTEVTKVSRTAENLVPSPPSSELALLRNMEEFAALGQYLFMFGVGALNLSDFGREELETALLAPSSPLVEQIKLTLIKMVTSNAHLLIEQFDDQARNQYLLNGTKSNPFDGENMTVISFHEMDLSTRIRVLHQLSIWTFKHPIVLREKMGDIDISEELLWRMEPAGYDSKDNEYFILDDDRLYRRSPLKEILGSPPKKKLQMSRAGRKRKRIQNTSNTGSEVAANIDWSRDWTCVCTSSHDWEHFVSGLKGSKNENEKALYKYLNGEVLPEIRRSEELKQKKLLDIEKERQKQEAVANRKRSSRIGEKMVRKKEEESRVAAERRQEEFTKKAQAEERKREKEREARLALYERQMVRQQKARERRLQAPDSRRTSGDENSVNSRRASTRVQTRRSRWSPVIEEREGDWVFDCRCGAHGKKNAGGSTIIACDKCAVWQHLACQNLPSSFTEGDFTCERCIRREAACGMADKKRVTIKLNVGGSTKTSPMGPSKDQGGAPQTIAPSGQPARLARVSQPEIHDAFKFEAPQPFRHSSGSQGGREDSPDCSKSAMDNHVSVPSKFQTGGGAKDDSGASTREESAQASADFLLFMADPGHNMTDSQKLGNIGSANGEKNSLSPESDGERPGLYESSKPLNDNSSAASSSFVTSLSLSSTCVPFLKSQKTNTNDSPEKNDAHPYNRNSSSQEVLTSTVSPINF